MPLGLLKLYILYIIEQEDGSLEVDVLKESERMVLDAEHGASPFEFAHLAFHVFKFAGLNECIMYVCIAFVSNICSVRLWRWFLFCGIQDMHSSTPLKMSCAQDVLYKFPLASHFADYD
eukprot:c15390_g1_i1 orf=486-842(+)